MNAFRAVLYKDFKLFLQKSGFLGFLLPFLLALLLSVGISDISKQTVVQPFQIAVRDQDNTIMSRSLISRVLLMNGGRSKLVVSFGITILVLYLACN